MCASVTGYACSCISLLHHGTLYSKSVCILCLHRTKVQMIISTRHFQQVLIWSHLMHYRHPLMISLQPMMVRVFELTEMHCSRAQCVLLQHCLPSGHIPEGQAGHALSGACLPGFKHQTGPAPPTTQLQPDWMAQMIATYWLLFWEYAAVGCKSIGHVSACITLVIASSCTRLGTWKT